MSGSRFKRRHLSTRKRWKGYKKKLINCLVPKRKWMLAALLLIWLSMSPLCRGIWMIKIKPLKSEDFWGDIVILGYYSRWSFGGRRAKPIRIIWHHWRRNAMRSLVKVSQSLWSFQEYLWPSVGVVLVHPVSRLQMHPHKKVVDVDIVTDQEETEEKNKWFCNLLMYLRLFVIYLKQDFTSR